MSHNPKGKYRVNLLLFVAAAAKLVCGIGGAAGAFRPLGINGNGTPATSATRRDEQLEDEADPSPALNCKRILRSSGA